MKFLAHIFKATLVSALFLTGSCTYLSQSMRSEQEKMVDLEATVAKVHKIYAWQDFDKLVPMFDGLPNETMRQLTKAYKGVRFNEVMVDEVNYKDDMEKAYSTLEIKSFSSPSYVVQSHFDQIEWVFKPAQGGWRIKSITIGKAKEAEE